MLSMTFNELLLDAIKYDEEKLAYSVFWLINNDIYKATDYAHSNDWDLVNHDEVNRMRERNELNMSIIKLYTIPLGKNKHILVFAVDEKSARGHCVSELGIIPGKVIDITNKIDTSFWFPEENKYRSLRELRDETLIFPATAMIYEK